MSKQLPADQWGEATTSWGIQFFKIRVIQEQDEDRLRAAVKAEAEGKARRKRIAILNKQLTKQE